MAIRTSDNIAELSEALVKAQGKFASAIKDATNPQYRSKYADLTSVIAAMVPHLNSEGLAVMQHPSLEYVGGNADHLPLAVVTVTTRIQHKSGQFIESDLSVPAVQRERFDAQSVGSAITYACRYGLQSIGVLGREDDDGTQAVGGGTREAAQAVGDAKVAALKAKMPKKDAPAAQEAIPSLFYVHTPSGFYEILGDEGYKSANRDLLKQFWQPNAKAILVNDEQLEGLKFHFEERKVPFSLLKEPK